MVSRTTSGRPIALLLGAVLALTAAAIAVPAAADDAPLVDASATTEDMLARARAAFNVRNYSLSQSFYEDVLRRDRNNLQAMLELSNVYERTRQLEYARGLLIRATRIDPRYPAIEERRKAVDRLLIVELTAEVDSLLGRADYETAMAKLSMHHTIDPSDASVRYKRALCMFEMGRLDAALTEIDAAVAVAPLEPYFVLRDRIMGESRRGEVKQLARQAGHLAKSDSPRNRSQALELVDRILELDPEHAWARNERDRLRDAVSDSVEAAAAAEENGPGTLSLAFQSAVAAAFTLGRFVGRHLTAILVLIAVVLVFRSPLTKVLSRRFSRRPLLSGDLSRFSAAEVLTMLNAEPHTGALDIIAANGRGRVYFEGGEPCHCTWKKLDGADALMSLVNNTQKGRFVFREGSIPLHRTIDTPLSLLLVEQAHKRNGIDRFQPSVEKKSRMKELLDSKL